MSNLLKTLFKYEPVVLAWTLDGGLAVLLGVVFHISSTQESAVTTIATGIVGVYTWFMTKSSSGNKTVPALIGILTTIATAATTFGLHLTSSQIGAGAAVLSAVLALVLRQNVSPAVSTVVPAPSSSPSSVSVTHVDQ